MNNDMTQTPADVRGRIIRASMLPFEDEETMIAGLRAGAEAVERGELDAEAFAGIWSQYLRELFHRASSVPTPADVRERIKAAIRDGVRYVAKADGAYLYEPSVDETADRILALLRTPRGGRSALWWAANELVAALEGRSTLTVQQCITGVKRLLAEADLRTPRGEGERVQEPTQEQIDDACMWYRHDFGLLSEKERDSVRFEARQWFRAWGKALSNGDDPAARRDGAQGEDRWEDLVFGPITQAYDEAHAARRSDAQEGEEDVLVCASCGEPIGDEPTVIWQDAYTHYRCTPEDAIRDDTPVIRPIDTARRGEGGEE